MKSCGCVELFYIIFIQFYRLLLHPFHSWVQVQKQEHFSSHLRIFLFFMRRILLQMFGFLWMFSWFWYYIYMNRTGYKTMRSEGLKIKFKVYKYCNK